MLAQTTLNRLTPHPSQEPDFAQDGLSGRYSVLTARLEDLLFFQDAAQDAYPCSQDAYPCFQDACQDVTPVDT